MTEIDPRRGFESEACSIYHIYNRDSKFIDLSYVQYQVILQKFARQLHRQLHIQFGTEYSKPSTSLEYLLLCSCSL